MLRSTLSSVSGRSARRDQRHTRKPQRLFDQLEWRTLLTAVTGLVEVFANGTISGWASDPDSPNSPVTINVSVDGVISQVTANISRTDGNQGFTTTVGPGTHKVIVAALDVQDNTATLLKSGTITNATPSGAAVVINGGTGVAGFATDANATGQVVQVQVYVNGSLDTSVTANQTIAGLPAGHAFAVTTGITAGDVVDVFALDAPSGQRQLIFTNDRASRGGVEVLNRTTVKGWVWDPDRGTSPVDVAVLVDGAVVAQGTANGLDSITPNLASLTGTANRQYNFDITSFVGAGTHFVVVVAKEAGTVSKAFTILGTASVTNPSPAGGFFLANNNIVAGWVGDADSGASPLSVTLKVDGVTKGTTTTNIPVSQTVKPAGATYTAKGFAVGLSGLTVAPHFIQIFVTDVPSGKLTLVNSMEIGNHAPFGALQLVNENVISGFAYDPDSPNAASKVRIVMDGTDYGLFAAGNTHTNLSANPGLVHHGFDVSTPTNNLNALHTVLAYAVDTFDGSQVFIGSMSFYNHAPVGAAGITRFGISGYAYDPDAPALTQRIAVAFLPPGVKVGSQPWQATQILLTANLNVGALGNHGFFATFSTPFPSGYTIGVFSTDGNGSGLTSLIGVKTV